MVNKLVKIKEIVDQGTFKGWFKDYEGNVHNPKRANLWVEENGK